MTQETIFIVDDQPDNVGVLFESLEAAGFKVLVDTSGESALEAIGQVQPDMILLDVMMPGMDGFETCRRLKAGETTKDIPVIFVTALSEPVDEVKGLELGAVDYITKPFQIETVLARVKTHLTIQRLQQDLREQNATKDKFFSIIAHDLRGPLSSLHGLTRLIVENFDNYNPEDLKEAINLQHTSVDNLYKLMDNLLTWSRIQRGMIDYRPQQISIGVVAARNVVLLTPNAEQKQITLRNSIQEQMAVYADFNMVDTVVRNLISNALRFTEAGGTVEISATPDDDVVEVSVLDTGIGIGKERIPKLFRIDTKYKRLGTAREKGTGLGLILCKEFVEKNGGRIWVESEVGKGSVFRFTLPKKSLE